MHCNWGVLDLGRVSLLYPASDSRATLEVLDNMRKIVI